jgi:DnaJ-class molecular chaperone with C-terminal Zn finger domain
MIKIAAFLCVFFSLAVAAYSQQTARRTVTNSDLQKFSQKRTDAEREYRETYAARGLPSPEQIQAQSDARVKEELALAAKLEAADLERERLALAAMSLQPGPVITSQGVPYYSPDYGFGGFGFGGFAGGFGNRFGGRGFGINQRYYAAGGMIWPAPLTTGGTRPRPMFSRPIRGPIGGHRR